MNVRRIILHTCIPVKLSVILFTSVFFISMIFFTAGARDKFPPAEYDGSELAAVALSQTGNEGGEKYWRWCGFDSKVDWCACFISWCAARCSDSAPELYSCADFAAWFDSHHRFYDSDTDPVPGMVVLFDNDYDRSPDHMGIVTGIRRDQIHVVEGNRGDTCCEVIYTAGDNRIYGYGIL